MENRRVARSGWLMFVGAPLILALQLTAGQTIYVDDDAPEGGDGQSWQTAFRYLHDAIKAPLVGTTPKVDILIAGGTYIPGQSHSGGAQPAPNRHATFQLKSGMALYGGYGGIGAADPDERDIAAYETILSGDLNGDDEPGFINYAENVYHVVSALNMQAMAFLDGLTVRGGNADAAETIETQHERRGAGIYALGGKLSMVDCLIRENVASSAGSGLGIRDWEGNEAELLISNCRFEGNDGVSGGTIFAGADFTIVDCVFESNSAGYGACMRIMACAPLIVDCLFIENEAYGAGAISNGPSASPTIIGSIFAGNSSGAGGGAVSNDFVQPSTYIDCLFIGNSADKGGAVHAASGASTWIDCTLINNSAVQGGAGYTLGYEDDHIFTFINCLLAGNTAEEEGGVLYNHQPGDVRLTNCTITGNSARDGGAVHSPSAIPRISNCILYGNSATDGDKEISGGAYVSYSLIDGGWSGPGEHIIDGDPKFVDAAGPDGLIGTGDDDLRLMPGSPCIDAGDNSALADDITTDLDDNDRFVDNPIVDDTGLGEPPVVDMGAYEFRLGDLDHSGGVDVIDLLSLLSQWGPCNPESPCTADLDASGSVDVLDLLHLLGAWSQTG